MGVSVLMKMGCVHHLPPAKFDGRVFFNLVFKIHVLRNLNSLGNHHLESSAQSWPCSNWKIYNKQPVKLQLFLLNSSVGRMPVFLYTAERNMVMAITITGETPCGEEPNRRARRVQNCLWSSMLMGRFRGTHNSGPQVCVQGTYNLFTIYL